MKTTIKGFTIVELMIAISIVAILVSLSYPSYINFVRKAERSDAQMVLLDWANRQQAWRADHPDYKTGVNPVNTELYAYTMVSSSTSCTLTATALSKQKNDTEAGVSCGTLTLDQTGLLGPKGHEQCWRK